MDGFAQTRAIRREFNDVLNDMRTEVTKVKVRKVLCLIDDLLLEYVDIAGFGEAEERSETAYAQCVKERADLLRNAVVKHIDATCEAILQSEQA